MRDYACVGFLTDYGMEDGFAAVCHAVLARLAPQVRVVDITHLVPPQDVRRGAAVLADAAPWFPPAILLAVVDPGVGTQRRAVAVEAGSCALVGPDNGLLSWACEALGGVRRAATIDPSGGNEPASATFHGRDVFAPAAARLANGASLDVLGSPVEPSSLVRLPAPVVRRRGGVLETEVLTADRFGNLQLAARPADLLPGIEAGAGVAVWVRHERWAGEVRYGRTFAEVPPGQVLLLVDSAGRLALAVNGGSASATIGAQPGDLVTLEPATG